MTSIKKNIAANMVGSAFTGILSIAFIPLYIRFMGIEAYGLVGFFVTLQALLAILDLGLTSTVSRELAKLSVKPDSETQAVNLVRTLEVIYWAVAIVIALFVIMLAPWISTKWLHGNELSTETVQQSVMLMGVVIAFRMPYGFYCGGLLGLQRQVLLNVIKIIIEVFKSGGVVLFLWLVSPTITAFFIWHLAVGSIAAFLMLFVLWQCLPKAIEKPIFQPTVFLQLWRFMAGMSGIAILSVILVETDKIMLSKMLPLDEFAYYVLASMVTMGLYVIIVPIYSAVYPRLTQLVESQDPTALKLLYHKSCQFMTVLVMPIAVVISFYSDTLLLIWTQDESVTSNSAPILSILIIGTGLNAMMNIPYALQLAHGWTKLSVYSNIIAIAVIIPLLLIIVPKYGAIGAAFVWVILNLGYILFSLPIVHAKLMRGELQQWFIVDFGLPSLVTLVTVTLFWVLMPSGIGGIANASWIALSLIASLLLSAFSAPIVRRHVLMSAHHFRLTE